MMEGRNGEKDWEQQRDNNNRRRREWMSEPGATTTTTSSTGIDEDAATKAKRKRLSLGPLSEEMKKELMGMALKKIHDPWATRNDELLESFCEDVKLLKPGDKSKSLVEYGSMLEASTKIFAARADDVYQRVVSYREELVRSRKEKELARKAAAAKAAADENSSESKETEKDRKRKSDTNGGPEAEMTKEQSESVTKELATSVEFKVEPPGTCEDLKNVIKRGLREVSKCFTDGDNDNRRRHGRLWNIQDPIRYFLNSTEKNPATDSGIESEPSTDEPQDLMNDVESNNLEGTQDLIGDKSITNENSEPVIKRKKIVYDPPTLISCHEELEELQKAGLMCSDGLNPPILDLAVRISRKKCVLYAEDNFKIEKRPHEITIKADKKVEPKKSDEDVDMHDSNDTAETAGETVSPQASALSVLREGLAVSAANAATFSAEDQSAIQECINELHYLPFTFELSKADLASAFNKTVERMSRIFQKNNVEVTRNMVKEATVISCNSVAKEPDKPSGSNGVSIHPAVISLGDIYNTFVKSCREECETFMSSTKAILERTKEKTFAESRANIRAMIAELQRNIVPKFARVPLMAENTPEFFQHVTMFEKRMKKVLEEEAKKEEFDVRKYEREVLEVTVKESNEIEGSLCEDTFLVPQSPMKSLSIDKDIAEMMAASPSTRSSFDGSQSSSGGGWVPLRNIFQHMKNIDKTEAARLFYAVLALLSYQNLDMNYDQLYSAESAAIITKQLQSLHTKDEDIDNKFHRGVKICTSRCPDIDKEEVFVSALTSESRDEAFRHLLSEGTKNTDSNGNPVACSSSSGRIIDEGIAEAMADFIEESGSMFHGRLESKKRKKKVDTS